LTVTFSSFRVLSEKFRFFMTSLIYSWQCYVILTILSKSAKILSSSCFKISAILIMFLLLSNKELFKMNFETSTNYWLLLLFLTWLGSNGIPKDLLTNSLMPVLLLSSSAYSSMLSSKSSSLLLTSVLNLSISCLTAQCCL
jgi:hypothetical protein